MSIFCQILVTIFGLFTVQIVVGVIDQIGRGRSVQLVPYGVFGLLVIVLTVCINRAKVLKGTRSMFAYDQGSRNVAVLVTTSCFIMWLTFIGLGLFVLLPNQAVLPLNKWPVDNRRFGKWSAGTRNERAPCQSPVSGRNSRPIPILYHFGQTVERHMADGPGPSSGDSSKRCKNSKRRYSRGCSG